MKYWIWSIIFLIFVQNVRAQMDTISLSGLYYYTNVYVYNPSVADSFSVQSIIINQDTINDELKATGLELDLSIYELEEGQRVNIKVIYLSNYAPVVVNPQALMPPVKFRISKPRYNKDNELQWQVTGIPGDSPIIVEQYKWNTWRTLAEIDPVDTVANNRYTLHVNPHSGKNIFRVKTFNIKGQEVMSKELIFGMPNSSLVTIQTKKIENEIVLSSKTEYEIYDLENNLLLSGYDRYIKINNLESGKYLLFFDNQIREFKKRR